ncbi:MAG: sodium/proton-translocating pyrophosphatase, partial [Planctomycetota bacterium]|nr:sodium/proton-translocating pyrophosphatase [Planctomycetota bacterium]
MDKILSTDFVLVIAAASLAFAFLLSSVIAKMSVGDEKMAKIAEAIRAGAMAFLKTEYSVLGVFVVVVG